MKAHAQFAADFNLSEHPRHKGADGTHRDELPQPTFHKGGEAQAVRQVGRRNTDLPQIPSGALRCAPQNHGGS